MLYRSFYRNLLILVALVMGNAISSYAQELNVVHFSKEQLQAESNKSFLQPRNLGSLIVSNLRELAVTLTERQSGKNSALRDLALSSRPPSDQAWMKRMASLSFEPSLDDGRPDEISMRKTFLLQSRKAAEVNLKRKFPIWQQFKNGLTFNLNLGKAGSAKSATSSRQIRYGLVERDILPADQSINLAVFGSIDELDRTYSTQAKVIYTIDRIDAESSHPNMVASNSLDASNEAGSRWTKFPSPKMTIKIDAVNNDESFGDQVASGGFPGARVTVKQFEGLITTQFMVGNKSIEKTMTTEFSAPAYRGVKISQKVDGRFSITETAAQNLLGSNQPSQLNVYYSRKTNAIRGEWQLGADGVNYSLTAESTSLVSPDKSSSTTAVPDKVSFAVQTNF